MSDFEVQCTKWTKIPEINVVENIEGAIKNGLSRETGNVVSEQLLFNAKWEIFQLPGITWQEQVTF